MVSDDAHNLEQIEEDRRFDDPDEWIKSKAEIIAEMSIPELNRLTLALSHYGVAATFSQYIPELHNEDAPTEDPEARTDPSLDNSFGGREPG